jgi:3'(2'), 5'-bisphosphate nucleotidase
MDELTSQMLAIGREAAREVMAVYEAPFQVDYKGPADPVTEADRRANTLICQRLRELEPETPVVAEESPEEDWADFRDSSRVFFVDPVDGTRAFVERRKEFVVMIGLLEGDSPTRGVLVAPALRTAWIGVVGEGAFRIDSDGSTHPVSVEELSNVAKARVVSSRSHRTSLLERSISALGAGEVLAIGSAGLKGAAVVDGRAHIYLASDHAGCRWDSCAPEAILRAAGATYTDALGTRLDYRAASLKNNRGIIAASPAMHEEAVRRVAPIVLADPSFAKNL